VEELLSRTIMHQEGILGLLISNSFVGASLDTKTGQEMNPDIIS
jgi:hypothetical protein